MARLNLIKISVAFIILTNLAPLCQCPAEELRDLTIGQQLDFLLSWNGIPVGTVTSTVEGLSKLQSRKAYRVMIHAKTNKWASLIYNVDDKFTTYIDYRTSSSLRHEVIRSEGRYRKKTVIEYIYGKFLAEYQYPKSGKTKTVNVSSEIHDPVSAMYYFLRRELKIGDKIHLNMDLNEKSYNLTAKIEKGRKIYIHKLGRLETLLVRPYVERKGKPFKKGNGWAYLSPEKNLPLYAVIKVYIWGGFRARLRSVKILGVNNG